MAPLISDALTDLGQLWPWWLSSMLKATVWLAAGALVDRAFRQRSSSLRHVVAVLVALGVPLIFILNLSPRPETNGWKPLTPVWERVAGREGVEKTTALPAGEAVVQASPPHTTAHAIPVRLWPGLVVGLWGAGVLVHWIGLVAGTWPRRGRERLGDRASDTTVVQAIERESRRIGLTRGPRLLLVPDGVPRLTGVWRPTLELPAAARDWSEEKLAAVLRHELAHVRRADLRWLVATEAVLALVWAHPLGILLRRRMARLREEACDDAVLASGMEPATYAAHLASFLTVSGPASRSLSLPAAERTGWSRRFRRLLDPRASRKPIRAWEVMWVSLLAGAFVVGGTLLVGCASPETPGPAALIPLEKHPGPKPTLRPNAQKLRVTFEVFELSVREEDAITLGFPGGFPRVGGQVLTQEAAWQVFHPERKGIDHLTMPVMTVKPGQVAKVEVSRPLSYPLEARTNPQTGTMEVISYEETSLGVFLTAAARPTEDAGLVKLKYKFEIKELVDLVKDPATGIDSVHFNTRMISDDITMRNGSFIIVGFKPGVQTVEDTVPVLSEIPLVGRLFRVIRNEKWGQLAAVRVIVEEASD